MLSDLSELQESDESVWSVSMSFDIETRSEERGEIVHKTYTFSYSNEWDKWTFQEYHEERTPDTTRMTNRNWKQSRHIVWSDSDAHTIDVPPEVADALAEATGADSVTIQVPRGSINETKYETVKQVGGCVEAVSGDD